MMPNHDPYPMRVTAQSFLDYAEELLHDKKEFEKIKEYVGNKQELFIDEAEKFLNQVIEGTKAA